MMPTENELLHRGAAPSQWRNLGCWPAEGATERAGDPLGYAAACAALADRVARGAALQRGDHVLSLGCGRGEELLHWVLQHGAEAVVGIEQDARLAHAAHQRIVAAGLAPRRVTVLAQSGPPPRGSFAPERFDAVLSVDAAYHFSPRSDWLLAAHASLRPGGRLAYTDLSLRGGRLASALLRRLARACGIAGDDLCGVADQAQRLNDVGFEQVDAEPLDDEVLGGFVRFAARQRGHLGADARASGWRDVRRTAALIGPARALGLGYTLFSACKPART